MSPSPWAIHGEEAKTGARQPVQMSVAVRHYSFAFVAAYSEYGWSTLSCSENGSLVFAPYTELDDAYTRCFTAWLRAFQYVDEAHQVCIDIRVGSWRVTHAGLRGEVNHSIEAIHGEQRCHALPRRNVDQLKAEIGCAFRRSNAPASVEHRSTC